MACLVALGCSFANEFAGPLVAELGHELIRLVVPKLPAEVRMLRKVVEQRQSEESLAHSVMRYLSEHPNAMDTLDGIAEWWIMRQQVRVDVEKLTRVLARLTENGRLDKIGSGDKARYRLKSDKEGC